MTPVRNGSTILVNLAAKKTIPATDFVPSVPKHSLIRTYACSYSVSCGLILINSVEFYDL